MCAWIETLVPMIIGGVVTRLAACVYYKRATRDLKQTAGELKQSVEALKGVIAFFGHHHERFP